MLMIIDPPCLVFAEVNYFPRRMPEQDIKQRRAKAAECLEQARQARHQPRPRSLAQARPGLDRTRSKFQ
jgi:hypothetical protein